MEVLLALNCQYLIGILNWYQMRFLRIIAAELLTDGNHFSRISDARRDSLDVFCILCIIFSTSADNNRGKFPAHFPALWVDACSHQSVEVFRENFQVWRANKRTQTEMLKCEVCEKPKWHSTERASSCNWELRPGAMLQVSNPRTPHEYSPILFCISFHCISSQQQRSNGSNSSGISIYRQESSN